MSVNDEKEDESDKFLGLAADERLQFKLQQNFEETQSRLPLQCKYSWPCTVGLAPSEYQHQQVAEETNRSSFHGEHIPLQHAHTQAAVQLDTQQWKVQLAGWKEQSKHDMHL